MTFNAAALLLLIAGLALIGWLAGRARSNLLAGRSGTKLHSRPQYHGWYVALWLFAPAALFLAVWASVSPALITNQVLSSEAAQSLPPPSLQSPTPRQQWPSLNPRASPTV